jgi:flagellar biosynthesis/type III secretory pathway chaperone
VTGSSGSSSPAAPRAALEDADAALREWITLLEAERGAIEQSRLEALATIAAAKQQVLAKLETARRALAQSRGTPRAAAELLDRVRRAQSASAAHARVLAERARLAQARMAALNGPRDSAAVYSERGVLGRVSR